MANKLKYVSAADPGYSRKGRGKGFEYFDHSGNKITEPSILQRIHTLKIPPNWSDVWVCKDPCGHLQVTGKDARGRKQYLYHEEWNKMQSETKFKNLEKFARSLPAIRAHIEKDLRKKGWPKEKVLALVISILDDYYLRIGNPYYREQNETYGLTTLRRKHLKINGTTAEFQYKSKSGKYRKVNLKGKKLVRLIKSCSRLPGYEIFKYVNEQGDYLPIHSQDVNEYLKEISGDDFTAKDFRTWGGTVLAVELFDQAKAEVEAHPGQKLATCLVRHVARKLGNTIAICREYYIHPAIFKRLEKNDFNLQEIKRAAAKKFSNLAELMDIEELAALCVIS